MSKHMACVACLVCGEFTTVPCGLHAEGGSVEVDLSFDPETGEARVTYDAVIEAGEWPVFKGVIK